MKKVHPIENGITPMPAFNKTISILVDVDEVYKKLLALLPEDYKHREVLAHAIIGPAVENGSISYIYNPLHGYTNEIDFEVDQEVICDLPLRSEWYDANKETENKEAKLFETAWEQPDYKPNWQIRQVPVGKCTITEINLYSPRKLVIRFENANRYSRERPSLDIMHVDHKSCHKVPSEDKW